MGKNDKTILTSEEWKQVKQETDYDYEHFLALKIKNSYWSRLVHFLLEQFQENILFGLFIIFVLNFVFYIAIVRFQAIRIIAASLSFLISSYDFILLTIGGILLLSYIGYRFWKAIIDRYAKK